MNEARQEGARESQLQIMFEELLREPRDDRESHRLAEMQNLVFDLGVRQRELEKENQGLRDAVTRLAGINCDQIDHNQAEAARASLAAIVESSDDAIIGKSLEGTILSWNSGAEHIYGYKAEEVVGQNISILVPPDYFDEVPRILDQIRRGERIAYYHTVRVRKDGARINVSLSVSPLRDAEGRVYGASTIARDITRHKEAEVALRDSEARHRAIFEATIDGLITIDERGTIESANPAATRLFGYTLPELIGTNVKMLMPGPYQGMHDTYLANYLRTGERKIIGIGREVVGRRKDGTVFPMDLSISEITVGGRRMFMGLVHDVTERKQAEEKLLKARDELELRVRERTADLTRANGELEQARQSAEAASRAKSTFLANMSHEIRTPLNAVIGMTELVLESPLSAQQRDYLMTVKDSGEALLSVINDILDFSKIEAGKLALDNSTFDLRESLGDTMKSFAIRAHEHGLELTCCIRPEVPRFVVGDYNRLRQIIVNLVGNAVKFTDRGEVDLEVTQESRGSDEVTLHFIVSDTGIGIQEEKRSTIFEMFEQGDNSMTRRHGGTGLGLAIAGRLVGLMNGRIWVESEVGRGSRFHFVIHLGLPETEPSGPAPLEPATLHGMHILVVDDNATNRRILEEVLRSWKMAPTCVPNAWEAIESIREVRRAGEPYQLVVTDAHMPRVDGFMLAEQIKHDPVSGSTVIMMLTSGDRPEDIARCDELGIAAYLLKPVKQSELLEAIEMALGVMVPREELLRSAAQTTHHVKNLRVLLAEDSLVNQKLAVALLEGHGHTVTLVNNGREAVTASDSGEFDLILMDIQMPEMDGLEAAPRIRAREDRTGKRLPIIAMTAHALKGDRERCLAAGMDGYVAKPIRAEELFATIDAMFLDGEHDARANSATDPGSVDWTGALVLAQGDQAVLQAMTEAALVEIPRLMSEMRQAIVDEDSSRLRFAAHTLKGSVRYFGARQAVENAEKLEDLERNGVIADAEAIYLELEGELARITAELSEHLQAT